MSATTLVCTARAPSRRTVFVSASNKAPAPLAVTKRTWALPALVAGLAAAQMTLLPAGPAVAEAYTPLPSIDFISEDSAGDVLSKVEEGDIPQVESGLGALPAEDAAAAEKELEAIEEEAAALSEEETKAPLESIAAQAGGIANQINALKAIVAQSLRGGGVN